MTTIEKKTRELKIPFDTLSSIFEIRFHSIITSTKREGSAVLQMSMDGFWGDIFLTLRTCINVYQHMYKSKYLSFNLMYSFFYFFGNIVTEGGSGGGGGGGGTLEANIDIHCTLQGKKSDIKYQN